MATHSSSLAREIPWTEEPGGLQSMGSQESDTTEIEPSAFQHPLPPGYCTVVRDCSRLGMPADEDDCPHVFPLLDVSFRAHSQRGPQVPGKGMSRLLRCHLTGLGCPDV